MFKKYVDFVNIVINNESTQTILIWTENLKFMLHNREKNTVISHVLENVTEQSNVHGMRTWSSPERR